MIFHGGPDPLSPPLDPHLYNNNLSSLSSIKKQLLLILKKSLLTEFEKKKIKILRKAMIFWGRACFGLVDRSTVNQLLFQVSLF